MTRPPERLDPPLQHLAAHPDGLVAVPHDPSLPFVALGGHDHLQLKTVLKAMGQNPDDYWIGTARLASCTFVMTWDRTVSATFDTAR